MGKEQEFISIIPAISSVPFISHEVIRDGTSIIIPNARPIEIVQEMPKMPEPGSKKKTSSCGDLPDYIHMEPCRQVRENDDVMLAVIVRGQVIATASLHTAHHEYNMGYIDEMDFGFSHRHYYGRERLTIRAQFEGDRLYEAIAAARGQKHKPGPRVL